MPIFIFLESFLFSAIFKTYYDKTKTLTCRNYEVISPLLEHCDVLCLVMDSETKAIGAVKGYFPPLKSQCLGFFLGLLYHVFNAENTDKKEKRGPVTCSNEECFSYFPPFVFLNIKVFPPLFYVVVVSYYI